MYDTDGFVQRGMARIEADLAKLPFRATPSWDDLKAMGESILRHMVEDRPLDVEPEPEKEPVDTSGAGNAPEADGSSNDGSKDDDDDGNAG